jgi:hypothetical protein
MALSVIKLANVSGGATVTTDISSLENEVGLLNFNRTVDNSAAIDNFVRGFSDAFVDETGVNTGSNSNSTYDSATNTYTPSPNVTTTQLGSSSSYWTGNTGNWSFGINGGNGMESSEGSLGGNARTTVRTSSAYDSTGDFLTVKPNNLSSINGLGIGFVDQNYASHIPGNTTANHWGAGIFSDSSSHWVNGNPQTAGVKASGLYFSSSAVTAINPRYYPSSTVSYSATDVFTFGRDSGTGQIYVKINGTLNTTLNNQWASGTNAQTIDDDFYIISNSAAEGSNVDFDYVTLTAGDGTRLASTFVTNAQTAESTPSTIRLIAIGQENDSQTMNTDTVFSISRDGGTTFTNVTMTDTADYNSSGVKIYTGTVDVSSQPSGTSIVVKQTTTALKQFTLHGYSLVYK